MRPAIIDTREDRPSEKDHWEARLMTKSVLVTGANGYTGSHLCQYLARRGMPIRGMYWPQDGKPTFRHENVQLVPGDLRDRGSVNKALQGIDVVYNIAALYRPTNVSNQMYWDVNVEGVRNIVHLAAEAGVERFVQCSTIGVHGHVENPPATEDAPLKPDDYYQYTKLKGEELCRELGRELGLAVTIVRPAAIYGPLEERFLKLPKLIQSGRFIMFGHGEVPYHFIHIDDLCDAFIRCAEREEAVGQTYIIADDHAITLNQIAAIISEALGVAPPNRRLPLGVLNLASIVCEFACRPFRISPPLHRRRAAWFSATRSFDIGKARRELEFKPAVRPADGLKDMIQSYRLEGWVK